MVIARTTAVRAADGDIEQLKATQVHDDEGDAMNKMQAEIRVESARLDASRPRCSQVWWMAQDRITVGVVEDLTAGQVHHECAPGGKSIGPGPGRPAARTRPSRSEPGRQLPAHDAASRASRRGCERAQISARRHLRQTPPPFQGRR